MLILLYGIAPSSIQSASSDHPDLVYTIARLYLDSVLQNLVASMKAFIELHLQKMGSSFSVSAAG